jgi:hypothetical protein
MYFYWEGALSEFKAGVLVACSRLLCDMARKMLAMVGRKFYGSVACLTGRAVVCPDT